MSHGVPTYTVTMDPRFPQLLASLARKRDILIVVHDRRFAHVFMKLLRELIDDPSLPGGIRFVSERRAPSAMRAAKPGTKVFLSPLVGKSIRHAIPSHVERIERTWNVRPSSLEWLRAGLALDRALQADPPAACVTTRYAATQ